jgi:uncharacterized surface protein with fasciclin (FAS1) repeats
MHPQQEMSRTCSYSLAAGAKPQEHLMTYKRPFVTALALTAAFSLSACNTVGDGMESEIGGQSAQAAGTVMVGGAAMYPSKTIVQNAVNSRDHTTLVAAVKAAGLVDTLSGPGPFTVFAPTNAAFAKLPAGTVDTLLKPENRSMLQTVLTYHVVPGKLTAADLMQRISAGGGQARLTTVQGGMLTARMMGGRIMLLDAKGGMSHVTQANVMQSNGVIHVTDAVSLPG